MGAIDPASIAEKYLGEIKSSVKGLKTRLRVVGFIATDDKPSLTYAAATKQVFDEVGFEYDLQHVKRLNLEDAIVTANEDEKTHGIFIYFPVFKNQQDEYLRNLVHYTKDIEAGSLYWTRKLYANDRLALANDSDKKALLPCTPLAIVKILTELSIYNEPPVYESGGKPLGNNTVTIFNRSEVIGRPLAVMMSNDGATVYSFDENGPLKFTDAIAHETEISRQEALATSNIVITGVPDPHFEVITANDIDASTVCINFSSVQNFADDIESHVKTFVPRVGPMTVAICMRNTIRLYRNFHQR
jgi:methylenetetrahydrofolate dehydrogenase (NAD+)